MGERVHVRTVRAQPVEEPDDKGGARIDYAKQDVQEIFPTFNKAFAWLHWFAAAATAVMRGLWLESIRPSLQAIVKELGGGRQIGFAIGMMFALGGLGGAIAHDATPVFWMALGGLIIGLTVRVGGASAKG